MKMNTCIRKVAL
jgi:hypothetical protein